MILSVLSLFRDYTILKEYYCKINNIMLYSWTEYVCLTRQIKAENFAIMNISINERSLVYIIILC